MATMKNEVLLYSSVPAPEMQKYGGSGFQPIFSEEEVRSTLETSASTGRFWLNWGKLKSILSYHLKQVLSEYPEAKMTSEQQVSLLGETFQELLKRLDDDLNSFHEGPPFTLQRLCEILLSAKSIYPKLSHLCCALEKTLWVTSTLTISSDPFSPASKQDSDGSHEVNGNIAAQNNSVENDRDEVMTDAQGMEVEETKAIEDATMHMESWRLSKM